jgi:hypothetical protein
MSKVPKRTLAKMAMADQVIINILYGLGRFSTAHGLRIRLWDETDEYRVIWMLFRRENVTYRLGEYRLYSNQTYPLVIHMYDRGKSFVESVLAACPKLFETRDPYLRDNAWKAP